MEIEARPAAAAAVFGERLPLADRLVGHLATSGVDRGLIGPRELPRLWTRHVLNCAVLTELIPAGVRVIDLGSGAGLPGLVVAVARPDLDIVLVEPLERRVAWLREVTDELGVDVTVHRARAEELAGEVAGQVVTARAVAPLTRLLEWGLPLVEPGGQVLAIKGRSASVELEDSAAVLGRWGIDGARVVTCGEALLETPTTVVRVPRGLGPGAMARGAMPRGGGPAGGRKPNRGRRAG